MSKHFLIQNVIVSKTPKVWGIMPENRVTFDRVVRRGRQNFLFIRGPNSRALLRTPRAFGTR